MLFNSYTFIFLFLPLAWVGFYAIARVGGSKWARAWLLVMSLGFYAWWNPVHLPLLLGSIVLNHVWAERIASTASKRARKWMMIAGVSLNVGLLAWFKYADFVLRSTLGTLGFEVEATGIMIPLAISFFTFQQIAYIVDAYREPSPGRPLLDYAVFVSFFPQLVAGPIIHHREMMPQLATGKPYSARARNVSVGLTMFALGLFKKVIIADELAQYPEAVFGAAAQGDAPSALVAWIGTLGFTFQVYFDFSGYSDMALGLARMFGLRLPMNFDSPLKAATISEFWRRWHITLSRFLRAYVYVPLGGGRAGMKRHHVNVVLTMLVCGIWHGAAWTFVVFGLVHGIYLIVQHHWSKRFRLSPDAPQWRRAFRCGWARVMTFFTFVLSLVLFRSADFASALLVYRGMFGVGESGGSVGGDVGGRVGGGIDVMKAVLWIGGAWAIVWMLPNVQEFLRREDPALDWTPTRTKWRFGSRHVAYPAWSPRVGWAIVVVGMMVWSVLNLDRVAIFVYWQF